MSRREYPRNQLMQTSPIDVGRIAASVAYSKFEPANEFIEENRDNPYVIAEAFVRITNLIVQDKTMDDDTRRDLQNFLAYKAKLHEEGGVL